MARWTECCKCKEPFALHPETEVALRRSGATFHCPWGHPQHFIQGPSEAELLRKERDTLRQQAARKDDELRAERAWREAAQNQARAYKGVATRVKNRVAKGVCPCCNRTFVNLQRHMEGQHPTFQADEIQHHGAVQ